MTAMLSNGTSIFSSVLVESISVVRSPYHYVPTHSIAILFVVLFSISTLTHIAQTVYFRTWWWIPTACLCGLLEVIGWAARLWSSISPGLLSPFEMQLTATILAPTPLAAANFVILGKMIIYLGPQYSRLSPKMYAIVFCICDIISLVVQAIGGGKAAGAAGRHLDPTLGGNIMLAGIIIQMVTITVYVMCASEFFVRYINDVPLKSKAVASADAVGSSTREPMGRRLGFMSITLIFSTVCLFIRAVYRTIELSDGWNGRIIGTEVYFNVLDGAMITLAIFTMNIAHPGAFLPSRHPHAEGNLNGKDAEYN